MELSILIARIISLLYLSVGVGAIVSMDYYRRLVNDLFDNAGLTYVTGFMTVVIGVLIVNYHNIWTWDWVVLITIIGWLALIKGVLILACPKVVLGYSRRLLDGRVLIIFPYMAILMGLLFGYFGFFT